MMRGRKHMAVAVRAPDGSIVVHEEPLTGAYATSPLAKWPFLRGVMLLWESLALGSRALRFSAAVAEEEAPAPANGTTPAPAPADRTAARRQYMDQASAGAAASLAISLVVAVAVFFVGPLLLVNWLDRWIGTDWASNLIEGGIRLALLLGYIWA